MAIRNACHGWGAMHWPLLHRVVAPAVLIPMPVAAARRHEFVLRDSTRRAMLSLVPRRRQTGDRHHGR